MTHERSRRSGSGGTFMVLFVGAVLGAAFGGQLLEWFTAWCEWLDSLIR